MVNEWWGRPSKEGRPDYSSRVSTEKGLGLDEAKPKINNTYPTIRDNDDNALEPTPHRSRSFQGNSCLFDKIIVKRVT